MLWFPEPIFRMRASTGSLRCRFRTFTVFLWPPVRHFVSLCLGEGRGTFVDLPGGALADLVLGQVGEVLEASDYGAGLIFHIFINEYSEKSRTGFGAWTKYLGLPGRQAGNKILLNLLANVYAEFCIGLCLSEEVYIKLSTVRG